MRSDWERDPVVDRRLHGSQTICAARLAEATGAAEEWKPRAACRGMSPDFFFPPKGALAEVKAAKAVCAGCEVRVECLGFAMAMRERDGVFGGLSGEERRTLRRRNRKAAA